TAECRESSARAGTSVRATIASRLFVQMSFVPLPIPPPEHKRAVLASERNAVCHGVVHRERPRSFGDIVQIAFGVGAVNVNSGRRYAVAHRQEGCCHTCGSASALRVAD